MLLLRLIQGVIVLGMCALGWALLSLSIIAQ